MDQLLGDFLILLNGHTDSLKEEPVDSEDTEKNPLEEETSSPQNEEEVSKAASDSEPEKPEEKPKPPPKPKPFKCDACNYASSTRVGLNFHKKKNHLEVSIVNV